MNARSLSAEGWLGGAVTLGSMVWVIPSGADAKAREATRRALVVMATAIVAVAGWTSTHPSALR